MKKIATIFVIVTLSVCAIIVYIQVSKLGTYDLSEYSNKNNTDSITAIYAQAKQYLQSNLINTDTYAHICDSLGFLFLEKRQYKEAEKFYLEASHLYKKGSLDYINIIHTIANLYAISNQYEKAVALLLELRQLQQEIGKRDTAYISSCRDISILYTQLKQYDKAETLFQEVRQVTEKVLGKQNKEYAQSCFDLGVLYQLTQKYEKAVFWLQLAKELQSKISTLQYPEYVNTCRTLAIAYINLKQYAKAEPILIGELKILEEIKRKETFDYAASCGILGSLYTNMWEYEKAESVLLESKRIFRGISVNETLEYAQSCNELGELYLNFGQLEKAETMLLEAAKIMGDVSGKETADYAVCCNDLGSLYREMGQYKKAETLLIQVKNIRGKLFGQYNLDYAQSCNNLATIYRDMTRYKESEYLQLESIRIVEKISGTENRDYAILCENLAVLYTSMGQEVDAEQLLLKVKEIREKILGKQHHDYAYSCNNLGLLYQEMGKYDKAETLMVEAKQIVGKTLGKKHLFYGLCCRHLAILYWLQHKPLLADKEFEESFSVSKNNLFSIFQFTNEKEKDAFIRTKADEDDYAYSFYFSTNTKPDQLYSQILFHRNLILFSLQMLKRRIFSSGNDLLIEKYNNWIGSRNHLSALYSKSEEADKDDVSKTENKADELEKELNSLSHPFIKQQDIGWKDIQNQLGDDAAAIEFTSFDYTNGKHWSDTTYYIALILRKNNPIPELVRLFEQKQLDSLLRGISHMSNNDKINYLYKHSNGLYNLVWQPLETHLKGIRKIYMAPSADLLKISFANLPINDMQVLGDRYQLFQLNTTADIANHSLSLSISSSDKIQVYGGVQYTADSEVIKKIVSPYQHANSISPSIPVGYSRGAQFEYLPGTLLEAKEIKMEAGINNKNITILSGVNATEESVKALDGQASPAILHIATHGFSFPDPKINKIYNSQLRLVINGKAFKQSENPLLRSGLAFAGSNNAWGGAPISGVEDGILTAYEVSNLYLPNTKLVVLSACKTALGDIQGNEGVYGLQRAFKMAEVKNIVMSLWEVPDSETVEFMDLFYKNLFAKQTISIAFNNAQQAMRKKYRNDPYKWAAWILVK